MLYNVSQLLKDPVGSLRRHALAAESIHWDGSLLNLVDGDVNLLRTHQGIVVNAHVSVESPVVCSRCIRIYEVQMTLDIEEEFFRKSDINLIPDQDVLWEQEGTLIDSDNILDLTEVIRQYAIASLPMKPLCGSRCKGLCQQCGVNLNELNCSCLGDIIDPRWADLLEVSENQV